MTSLQKTIQFELKKNASLENKKKYEWYFKHVIQFYGLKSPEIQKIFREFWKEISPLSLEKQIELAFSLFSSEFAEDKQFAILILQKQAKKLPISIITDLEPLIDKYVYDWATCDTFSSKVIRHLIARDKSVEKRVISWKDAACLWRQRAATISFLSVARHGKHNREILQICRTTITNPERFVQLGTGWVLRELSLADLDLVVKFIKKNYHHFSREGLRYAIEKMDEPLRKEILQYKN